ncbi:MAG TPA: ComEA family DNA-binding protein [Gemmatimonadales bacterium]|nr:ComEA family DNA-binding protein [Gemmatimonadales bacterium]
MLLLLALAVVGQGVRYLVTRPGEPPGQVQLLATLSPGSPSAQRDSAMHKGRPLGPGERVDVDAASASELARLPKVGPRLAKVIVADRQAHGAFGNLAGLDRVSGVGPGLLKVLAPHVVFNGRAVDNSAPLPLSSSAQGAPLDINSATAAELDALPGVGPAKAAAILQYRQQHGPFTAIEELARVPGFGVAAVARLRERVLVR